MLSFFRKDKCTVTDPVVCAVNQQKLEKGLFDLAALEVKVEDLQKGRVHLGERIGGVEKVVEVLNTQNLDKRVTKTEYDISGIVEGFREVKMTMEAMAAQTIEVSKKLTETTATQSLEVSKQLTASAAKPSELSKHIIDMVKLIIGALLVTLLVKMNIPGIG